MHSPSGDEVMVLHKCLLPTTTISCQGSSLAGLGDLSLQRDGVTLHGHSARGGDAC